MRLPIFYYNTYNTYVCMCVCVWILMSMIARVDFVEKTLKLLVYSHYTDNNYIISYVYKHGGHYYIIIICYGKHAPIDLLDLHAAI